MENSIIKIILRIYWDYENTTGNKPAHISYYNAIKNMKNLLKNSLQNVRLAEFSSCANTKHIKEDQTKELYEGGVDMKNVPAPSNSADYELIIEMFKHARQHPPPSYIVLISGDGDFTKALETLSTLGHTTILGYPENKTADELKYAADYTIAVENLFSGTESFSKTDKPNRSFTSGVDVRLKPLNPSTEVQGTNLRTVVYWDANSCNIHASDHKKAICHIQNEVGKKFGISPEAIKMHIYGDATQIPASEEIRTGGGATYTQTSDAKDETLEISLLVDMLQFSLKHPVPSNIVLITGNEKFARAAQHLGKLGYGVFIVVPSRGSHELLLDSANPLNPSFTWPPSFKKPEQRLYITPGRRSEHTQT